MKNFVISFGEKLVNIAFVLSCLGVIVGGFGMMTQSFIMGLLIIIFGFCGVVMTFLIIYLVFDIRQNIKELNEKSRG